MTRRRRIGRGQELSVGSCLYVYSQIAAKSKYQGMGAAVSTAAYYSNRRCRSHGLESGTDVRFVHLKCTRPGYYHTSTCLWDL
jgi:hypothetical protein